MPTSDTTIRHVSFSRKFYFPSQYVELNFNVGEVKKLSIKSTNVMLIYPVTMTTLISSHAKDKTSIFPAYDEDNGEILVFQEF